MQKEEKKEKALTETKDSDIYSNIKETMMNAIDNYCNKHKDYLGEIAYTNFRTRMTVIEDANDEEHAWIYYVDYEGKIISICYDTVEKAVIKAKIFEL